MDDIVPAAEDGSPAALGQEADAARAYAATSLAASTWLIYDADWQRFQTWCATGGAPPLPADPVTVARFCANEAEAGRAPSTITRRLAAIGWAHKIAGIKPQQRADGSGAIAEVMAGIRRSRAAPPAQKAAADAEALRNMLRACAGEKLGAVRARAVLAIGFAGVFRRSELVAPRVEDLRRDAGGIRVVIRPSKADQEGAGTTVAIPNGDRLRPVAALDDWLAAARVTKGFTFRRIGRAGRVTDEPTSDRAVPWLVQTAAWAAGYDPALFSGHSCGPASSPVRRGRRPALSKSRRSRATAAYRCSPALCAMPKSTTATMRGADSCKAWTIADRRRCATGSRNVVVFRALNLSGGGLH
jgi:integrase